MNRTRKFVLALIARGIVALSVVLVWSAASTPAQTPLPQDISIAAPSSAVAPDAAAFSGVWLGAWGNELPTALVVEQIGSDGEAHVIYAWGDSPLKRIKAGWNRQTGHISKGKLQLSSKGGPKIDFTAAPGTLLLGRYEVPDQPPSFAELHRIPATDISAILAAAKKPAVPWEEIRVPVQSQVEPTKGKTFRLQTTIFRQATAGRHPVVIYSHGSTGPGIIPPTTIFRGGNEETFFHSLGYVVVVPMRKGRGLSDGPNLEEDESLSPAVQLDSAVEDLQAIVEYVSRRDDVDPKKIVLAGVSRGGLLSVAYAGRHPRNVAKVINFSGGWFGEGKVVEGFHVVGGFNTEVYGKAGQEAKIPMLWLYADHDSFYSLKFIEGEFSKFRGAGGRGELVESRDIPGEGHLLCMWVDRWRDKVSSYLNGL